MRWPGESPSKLLLRLIDVGGNTLEHDMLAEDGTRHAAVTASSGRYAAAFGPDYPKELRAVWPA